MKQKFKSVRRQKNGRIKRGLTLGNNRGYKQWRKVNRKVGNLA